MSQTPPPVRETEFSSVNTTDETKIRQQFSLFVRSLHSYLNQLQCLRDFQKTRRRWQPRTRETEAFGGKFSTEPQHWYTFHRGGRREAQFNVGLCPIYLRVGLGFEFTEKKYGKPKAVRLAYACFAEVVKADQNQFKSFVADNQLEIEYADNKDGSFQIIPTAEVVPRLLNPLQEPRWIFVGRLLRCDQDAAVLENPDALGSVIQAVLCGFRPIWEQTQMTAADCVKVQTQGS